MAISDPGTSREAQRIISRFAPEQSKETNPDYLKSLADKLEVKHLLTRPLTGFKGQHQGVDAMLVPLPEGYSIIINQKAPYERQRFSFAHELAHIMLLASEPTLGTSARYRSSGSTTKNSKAEERLCDAIAAELLMPEERFTREVMNSGRSLEHLPQLASLFGTSLTATAIRYWELLPEPCHLIRWRSSTYRGGGIMPDWQMRNRVSGPRLRPVTGSPRTRPNEFRVIRETWRTLKRSISHESLLVDYAVGGKPYVRAMAFETESIGFGSPNNRAALSVVYLDRFCRSN